MSRRSPLWPDRPDTVPLPEEHDTDSAWAGFEALQRELDAQFAPTQPLQPPPLEPADPADAAPLTTIAQGVDRGMALARQNNRVCPAPQAWQQLLAQWPAAPDRPAVPPPEAAWWRVASALDRRALLRAHLDWAALAGCLPAALDWLEALPEAQWQHLGG